MDDQQTNSRESHIIIRWEPTDDQPADVLIQCDREMSDISDQQSQEMPDTSNQLSLPDRPPKYNHPCGDLFDQGRRRDYINICVPLFQASVNGDWEAMEEILANNGQFKEELLGYAITEEKSTTLHIAVFSQKSIKLVENLVNRMTSQQLALQDKEGRTALFDAAFVGNVDMARVMVDRCPQLLNIRGVANLLPIHIAGVYGKRNMVAYLYGKHKSMASNDWTSIDVHAAFLSCIEGDLFDCALKILEDQNNRTGFPEQACAREVLHTLARKTYAFKDMKSWKNSITWVRPTRESSEATQLLREILKKISGRSSDEINDILKGSMVVNEDDNETYPFQIPFVAAEMGNTKFLVEILRGYPDFLWRENDSQQNIFDIAVSHRHEGIYNLLYEMGPLADLSTHAIDKDDNNMLHLVGMKAKTPHEDVSGAVFQMQRELLWFKEVSSKVPPYYKERKNREGRTPLQLFIENHQDMVFEGEKWIKETANQCMVVAALVTTIVFSVAFTIPGGYDQNNGLPIFLKDGPFITFVILDAISLILSSASILMFLSILTSRYAQDDFLVALPKKLMIGLTTLFLSIISMMVAFSVNFFVLYHDKLISIPVIISVGAVVPISLYMKLQFPLLVDAYRSTYGSKYLFKPKKHVLFYRNPRF